MKKHKEQWNKKFEDYKSILKELGSKPSRKSSNPKHKYAAIWFMNQKKSFKENKLDKEQIKQLESLGINLGKEKVKTWDERYLELKKTTEELKSLPSINSDDDKHRSAAIWMRAQFNKIRSNDLNPSQLKKIKSLPFFNYQPIKNPKRKNSEKLSWEENFENFKTIYQSFGKLPLQDSKNKTHRRYASWITTQKWKFKRNRLTKDQINKLKELGIELDTYKKRSWLESFEKLKEIHKDLGKLPSRNSKDPEHRRSSRWLTNQKVMLNKGILNTQQKRAIKSISS